MERSSGNYLVDAYDLHLEKHRQIPMNDERYAKRIGDVQHHDERAGYVSLPADSEQGNCRYMGSHQGDREG